MAYPTTSNNLSTSHAAAQTILSADINAIAVDANQLTLKAGIGSGTPTVGLVLTGLATAGTTGWKPPAQPFKEMFGPLLHDAVPNSASLTTRAIAGDFDTSPVIAALPEATVSLATQLAGLASGATVRIQPGIYRETAPSISVTNVRLWANADVSIRGSDLWTTWSTASAPNAANGIVSTLTVPSFTAETDNGQFLGGSATVQSKPEQVFVDGLMYNRVAAGSTLAAGQWCFVNDAADRRVILFLAGGAAGHSIEVTRRQAWITPNAAGCTIDGIDFRHTASYANTTGGLENHSFADLVIKNCMLGYAHGMCVGWGGATGGKSINNVYHNNGTIAIDTNGETGFVTQGDYYFNNGGTNRRFGGALDGDGYAYTWGSGGIKLVGDKCTIDGCFAWNNGFAAYWFDVYCKWCSITNNVVWDTRDIGIHVEISSYYTVYGNIVFQTNSSRFYALTGQLGIYINSSRDGDCGPVTTVPGQTANVVMRMPLGIEVRWDNARVTADTNFPASWKVAGQKSVRNAIHNNVIITRIGGAITDIAMLWADDTSGSQVVAAGNGATAYENSYGFTNMSESGTGTTTWSDNYCWFSSKTGLAGMDGGNPNYWINVANLNLAQFGNTTRPSRLMTYSEVANYLDRYGLPQGN